ncbi:MAG: alternative ribosome rescue aminoacyl-tRNA hydrolase ArfB [Sandaracinaceae bacterium]
MDDLHISRSTVIPASDLSWSAARSGGPGGQNVNKVASKVDLRFDLPNCRALSPPVKARLRRLAANRLDADGRIMIASQVTRDQHRNLQDALQRLAELVRRALVPPKPRKKTKPSRGSVRRRLEGKKRNSDKKRNRQKVDY